MSNPKAVLGRKAAKAVVKHSAHGSVSKVKRQPARATTLVGLGAVLGGIIGYLAGRKAAPTPSPAPPPPPPTSVPAGA